MGKSTHKKKGEKKRKRGGKSHIFPSLKRVSKRGGRRKGGEVHFSFFSLPEKEKGKREERKLQLSRHGQLFTRSRKKERKGREGREGSIFVSTPTGMSEVGRKRKEKTTEVTFFLLLHIWCGREKGNYTLCVTLFSLMDSGPAREEGERRGGKALIPWKDPGQAGAREGGKKGKRRGKSHSGFFLDVRRWGRRGKRKGREHFFFIPAMPRRGRKKGGKKTLDYFLPLLSLHGKKEEGGGGGREKRKSSNSSPQLFLSDREGGKGKRGEGKGGRGVEAPPTFSSSFPIASER